MEQKIIEIITSALEAEGLELDDYEGNSFGIRYTDKEYRVGDDMENSLTCHDGDPVIDCEWVSGKESILEKLAEGWEIFANEDYQYSFDPTSDEEIPGHPFEAAMYDPENFSYIELPGASAMAIQSIEDLAQAIKNSESYNFQSDYCYIIKSATGNWNGGDDIGECVYRKPVVVGIVRRPYDGK